ncbi:coiled-coil domain-containing protein 112 [Platysternon megacephalum]|uniref:Coiled-coil domain-containing protein 112 n=1 Tax=Platysternon megacephalum TaxID=55544 RepID=A0A4D9F666_9SAUR|nr:coiled-coil domain-containing protein 112 [Platysternon megacephalum]
MASDAPATLPVQLAEQPRLQSGCVSLGLCRAVAGAEGAAAAPSAGCVRSLVCPAVTASAAEGRQLHGPGP